MHNFTIAPYSDSCTHEVAALILEIQKDEFGIPINLEMQPDLLAIPGYYQVHNGNFWIARYANKVIGTIALLDIGNARAALRKMFVAKEFRGKEFGVGQALFTHLLNWSKASNIQELYLGTTEKFIAAQRFYEKNGFIEIEKQELPDGFPIMAVDVKFYRLWITPGP